MKESSLFLGLLARRCIKGFTSSLEMHSCKWLSTQRERQVDADTSTILVKDLEAISCGGGSNWCWVSPHSPLPWLVLYFSVKRTHLFRYMLDSTITSGDITSRRRAGDHILQHVNHGIETFGTWATTDAVSPFTTCCNPLREAEGHQARWNSWKLHRESMQ